VSPEAAAQLRKLQELDDRTAIALFLQAVQDAKAAVRPPARQRTGSP
jgi:hypothetical protein